MVGVRKEVRENEDRCSLGAHASFRFDGQLQSPPALPGEREAQQCQRSGSPLPAEPVDPQSVQRENREGAEEQRRAEKRSSKRSLPLSARTVTRRRSASICSGA